MKTRYWLIICFLCLAIGAGGHAIINYKFFPCPTAEDFTVNVGQEHDATPIPGVSDPYHCGKTIHIDGTREDSKTLRVKAWTETLTNYRDFYLDFACPMPKWTLQLGILGGAGYMPEIKKYDALLGAEAMLLRHYKAFAVGGGVWYIQGMTTDFKAGGVKADFMFSWGKQ